jgi:hypothetical protein
MDAQQLGTQALERHTERVERVTHGHYRVMIGTDRNSLEQAVLRVHQQCDDQQKARSSKLHTHQNRRHETWARPHIGRAQRLYGADPGEHQCRVSTAGKTYQDQQQGDEGPQCRA